MISSAMAAANVVLECFASDFPQGLHETLGGNLVLKVRRGKLALLQLLAEPSARSSSSEMMHSLLWAAFAEYLYYVIFPVCHMWDIW